MDLLQDDPPRARHDGRPRHARRRAGGAGRRADRAARRAGGRMRFVLRMAVRETRASWRRLLFFFVCIAVGVAAIVALRSVIQSVRGVFGKEARSLIAADVLDRDDARLDAGARARSIDRRLAEAGATARTETIETPTMVRPADETQEGRADGGAARGAAGVSALRHDRARRRAALLARARRAPRRAGPARAPDDARPRRRRPAGDRAGRRSRFAASSPASPGAASARSPSARACIIDYADLPSTGLLGFGSRARRVLLVRVPDSRIQPLVRALRADLAGTVHQRALLPRERRRARARFRSGRELPEHGRPRSSSSSAASPCRA